MEKLLVFGLMFLVHQSASEDVIYKLSKADFSRMPLRNQLDRFDPCLTEPNGVFCTIHADIVPDGPSELFDMMRAYSAHHVKHFNYTNLIYGLCLTKTCRPFFNGSHDEADLWAASEACLNHSLSSEYGLKARATEVHCYFDERKTNTDWLDLTFTLFMLVIFALNFVATVYDVNRDQTKPGNNLLLAFSLRINWNQLTAPRSTNPRMVLLRSFHGIRAINALLVILGHILLPLASLIDNPRWFENAQDVTLYHLLAQGHLITLTFFLISGFLLSYNSQIQAETTKLKWQMLPMAIFNRWLRLLPINLVSLLITATWMKYTTHGPFWHEIIGIEVNDCRSYWYTNFFFINNFFDNSYCLLQTWYLACDMQFHIIGLCVVILAPSARVRWWLLGALFTIGFAWPAYNIYTMDLDATLLATPTAVTDCFLKDATFNYIYKQTHANMPIFVIGMVLGYLVYDWQRKNVFAMDLTKYRFIYWTLFPVALMVVSSAGFLFWGDGERASMGVRLAFGPIVKSVFISLVVLIILGTMFKVDNVQRSFMEWSGWVPLSRISYCIFSFHVFIIRLLGGTRTTLVHFSVFHIAQDYAGVVVITLLMALVFHLFVEAPFARLVKIALEKKLPSKPAVNGAAVNGATVNGSAVKGAAVNGASVNGSAVNGAAIKAAAVNGTKVNGAAVNGKGINGNAVNGNGVNGTALNGAVINETILNGKYATIGVKNKDA